MYVPTEWIDDQAPAIDAANLNKIEKGILDNATDIAEILDGTQSVAHALTADVATSLVGGIPSVPMGFISMYPSSSVPEGYMECNGATLPRTHGLFAIIGTTYGSGDGVSTFNIPDLRGVFPRGWDHGRGLDTGRALGNYQEDALQDHTHTVVRNLAPDIHGFGAVYGGAQDSQSSGVNGARKASETRPKNVAIMFIIKVV